MKIIFFGSRDVEPIIKELKDKHELALVITTPGGMDDFLKSEQIPYLTASNFDKELIDTLKKEKVDIGVIANFRLIIPKEVIDIFPKGVLNVHPSLLPKYRGSTPVQSAILNGDQKTGVTIIKIDEQIDHGAILKAFECEIERGDTFESLLKKLFEQAANALPRIIDEYERSQIKLKPQDDSKASYTPKLSKSDGFIDSSNPPDALMIERMIKAYHPWPGVWTKYHLGEKELIIKLLPDKKIQVEGKKPTNYKDFINGYPRGEELIKSLGLS